MGVTMVPRRHMGAVLPDFLRRQAQHLLVIGFIFSIFVNALMLTGPLFMLQVYDRVLAARSQETLTALILLVVALYSLMWLLDVARTRILARFGARLQTGLDANVLISLLSPRRGHERNLHLEQDTDAVQSLYASPAITAIMDLPFTPLFVLAIFGFHPTLGWLALAGGGGLIVLAVTNQVLTAAGMQKAQEATKIAHSFGNGARRGATLIRTQGMLKDVAARWSERRQDALELMMQASDVTGLLASLSKTFRLALQSMVLALGAWLVLKGELTAGAMIAASILLGRGLAPIEQVLARWPQIQRARRGWNALREDLSDYSTDRVRTELPAPEAYLSVRSLSVGVPGQRVPVLGNISFDLSPGEAVGVIGRSGSGKTTLARALMRDVTGATGDIRLGGAPLSHYDDGTLGSLIGVVPQETILFPGSVADNIARLSQTPEPSRVIDAARKARIHDLILTLPLGYDTMIDDLTRVLSGGQKQRLALARALYPDPVLLILDEPNSALDLDGTEALNAVIRDMKARGRAVVIMTHRPLAISECDRLIVLEAGRMTASGPRDEILKAMMRNAEDIQKTFQTKLKG